jgi:hypothetical protein
VQAEEASPPRPALLAPLQQSAALALPAPVLRLELLPQQPAESLAKAQSAFARELHWPWKFHPRHNRGKPPAQACGHELARHRKRSAGRNRIQF